MAIYIFIQCVRYVKYSFPFYSVDSRPERWCPHTILDFVSCRQELRLDNHSLRHPRVLLALAQRCRTPRECDERFSLPWTQILKRSRKKVRYFISKRAWYKCTLLTLLFRFVRRFGADDARQASSVRTLIYSRYNIIDTVYFQAAYFPAERFDARCLAETKLAHWKVGLHPPVNIDISVARNYVTSSYSILINQPLFRANWERRKTRVKGPATSITVYISLRFAVASGKIPYLGKIYVALRAYILIMTHCRYKLGENAEWSITLIR